MTIHRSLEDVKDEGAADVAHVLKDSRAPAKRIIGQTKLLLQGEQNIPPSGVPNPGGDLAWR